MPYQITKIVTEQNFARKSVFVENGFPESCTLAALPGTEIINLWGTPDDGAVVGDGAKNPSSNPFPFFPQQGGTRFVVLRFGPDSATPPEGMTQDEVLAEAQTKQPGVVEIFEPDNPGMHTSDTIDYLVCVDGEIDLELDDGQEAHVTPGTCIIQRGTRHAWRNRGDKQCTIIAMVVGAQRLDS
jgi:quercetin dioxygenase-like cupin family protein